MDNGLGRAERDLLIELKTEVGNIRSDIKDLRDGMSSRIQTLEKDKADRRDVDILQKIISDDVEKRLRKMETTTARYMITLGINSAIGVSMIGLIIYHMFNAP